MAWSEWKKFGKGLELPYDLLANQFGVVKTLVLSLSSTDPLNDKTMLGTVPIDFTNISTLTARLGHAGESSSYTFYIALTNEPLTSYNEIVSNATFTLTNSNIDFTETCDVSEIIGEKYFSLTLKTNVSSKTYNGYVRSLYVS